MSEADKTVHSLLRATVPNNEEGFHALLARATYRNRLGHTKVILAEMGLKLQFSGHASKHIQAHDAADLALILGCAEEDVLHRLNESIPARVGSVRHGTTVVRWSDVSSRIRRVCPELASEQEWLPAQWALDHLPYCIHCFLPLVDTCHQCGERLGWNGARGIAACPTCRVDVRRTVGGSLPTNLRDAYVSLFELSSIDPVMRSAATRRFPDLIASMELDQFLDVALALGKALTAGSEHVRRHALGSSTLKRTETYCHGLMALTSWPDSFLESADQVVRQSKAAEKRFWTTMRGMAATSCDDRRLAEFIRAELPGLTDDRRSTVLGLSGRYIGAREFQELSGLQLKEVRVLEREGLLGEVIPTGDIRKSFQINQGTAEEITKLMREAIPIGAAANRLGLPTYAIEQLGAEGWLTIWDHAALVALGQTPRVELRSILELVRLLDEACDRLESVDRPLRMFLASAYVGEKPYGPIISAILSGKIAANLVHPEPSYSFALGSRIEISDAPMDLRHSADERASNTDFRLGDSYVQRDAAEVLGIVEKHVSMAVESGAIGFERGPKNSYLFARTEVLRVASEYMSSAELERRTGATSRARAAEKMRALGVSRTPLGWPREATMYALAEDA